MADLGREIEVHEIELDEADAPQPGREATEPMSEPVETPQREAVPV